MKFKLSGPFLAGVAAAMLVQTGAAFAHHSYAMFDLTDSATVQGSIAKLEWTNPHVFIWVYVKKPDKPTEYDLFGFEGGPVGFMTRNGWSKDALVTGERVSVQYFRLRDGRTGGSFIKLVRADGSQLIGDQYSPGVAKALERELGKAGSDTKASP